MLWTPNKIYSVEPFEAEKDLETAILKVKETLFGKFRIYMDLKKLIGKKGKTRNIPDGYLIDLYSKKEPKLYLVENELAIHDPLKHIAVQILKFSLSFETTPQKLKTIIKEALGEDRNAWDQCHKYAVDNGFENVDYLLERMVYGKDAFNALVIIDEIPDELETILQSRFKFPVEIITLKRFSTPDGERIYQFDPFLSDISAYTPDTEEGTSEPTRTIDPSEIDTIIVPARDDGFKETFIGENCWYQIRIHGSMIPKIKHIAAYRVAPKSAITHVAPVKSIEQWKDTNKYILHFSGPAREIGPIKLVPKGKVKAPQNSRYTSLERLMAAKTLDEVFLKNTQ
ncbi:hypothetical protein ACFL2E_11805 [Thermodesulfobacteriota bacterium]